jgi:hypothetical protein
VSERNARYSKWYGTGLMTAALLTTLSIACSKTETKADVQTDTTTGETVDITADDPGLNDIPGRDTSETRQYLKTLRGKWTTAVASVSIHCETADECAGSDTVHIRIDTHRATFKIKAEDILGLNVQNAQNVRGHIVLKIVNLDGFQYKPLGLEARDSVYLWVGKTDSLSQPLQPVHRTRAFAVFRIDQDGNAAGVRRVYAAIHCKTTDPTSSAAHLVRRGICEEPGAILDTLYSETVPVRMANLVQGIHDQGLWFSCAGGCCQATNFGPY